MKKVGRRRTRPRKTELRRERACCKLRFKQSLFRRRLSLLVCGLLAIVFYRAIARARPPKRLSKRPTALPGARLHKQCGLLSAAVYFPQYHQDINNDIFWGKGFTEWDHLLNITYDRLAGHEIRLPIEKYDLDLTVLRSHAELAKQHGIGAFIFYYYWFEHGRRALQKPILTLLPQNLLGVNFALSWANEPWTRRWDGNSKHKQNGDILIHQSYGSSFDWMIHLDELVPFFLHPEYIHIDGKPILFIYHAKHISDAHVVEHEQGDCSAENEQKYGPGGERAAMLYKTWYPDVIRQPEQVYKHWKEIGQKEGRNWPKLSCTEHRHTRSLRNNIMAQVDTILRNKNRKATTFDKMITFLQLYATQRGLRGLYIIVTLGSFLFPSEFDSVVHDSADAAVQFLPMNIEREMRHIAQLCGCSASKPFRASTKHDCPPSCKCMLQHLVSDVIGSKDLVPRSVLEKKRVLFRGAFSSWSNYPRHSRDPRGGTAFCSQPDFAYFEKFVHRQLSLSIADHCQPTRMLNEAGSLLLLNAWNEWGEQAVLEPSVQDGEHALRAHARAMTNIEISIFV